MKIREIMPQDRDGWIPLWKGYQDYYEVDLSETTDNTWQPEPRCYLIDLFTAPHIRKKGIGGNLIKTVYEKADQHGCCQVYWLTQDFNKAGRSLYDKVASLTPFIKYQR